MATKVRRRTQAQRLAALDEGFLGEGGSGRVQVKAYCVKAHERKVRVRVAA
jgi:hypothetical protein